MVGMPRERPGDKFGTSQGHPGRLGRFMWKFTFKGQNVRGTDGTYDQMGHVHGRDGTQTSGCPAKIPYVLLVFTFPKVFRIIRIFVPNFEGAQKKP